MEQYKFFAECILPEHMLDWFDLVKIDIIGEGDDKQYHIYLEENKIKPEGRGELHENGFTRESVFQDFPIRAHKVLLHVKRRRWLDEKGQNVMTEYDFIQESTRCSKELADFLKETPR